ncbi:MAG: hypothetical protein LBP30_05585 [Clostridiales Family XIII bacterium]|jgi:hypothetical protein|nr:hypothetical protein [Clostridiales Family XIII bacterium]
MNFYISSFRYKIACVCFFGAVLSLANALLLKTPPEEILGRYGLSLCAMLALSFALWRPAFAYVREDARSLWEGRWDGPARTPAAEERERLRFERFYPKTKYALMRDPAGHRVATTLIACSCVEFRKKRAPCKHMFELARLTGALTEAGEEASRE